MSGRAFLLARVRAEAPLLAVCSLLLVVSAVAVSALVTLDGAAREDGLRARWQSLPAEQRAVEVATTAEESVPARGPSAGEADAAVRADVSQSLGPSGVTVGVLSAARSAQHDVLSPRADGAESLVLMAFDDLTALATLVDGEWPGTTPRDGPLPATLQADAAAALGVGVGDTVAVDAGRDAPSKFEVVATWRIGDTEGENGYPSGTGGLGAAGVAGSVLEVTGRLTPSAVGPLVPVDPAAIGPATRLWRVVPRVDLLTIDGIRALPGDLARMESRILADPRLANPRVDDQVRGGLPDLSNHVEGAGAVSRVALLLVAVVAVTTLLLTARLLGQRRAGQTALVRARGAAWRQVTGWASAETLLLAVPALGVALVALAAGRPGAAALLAGGALAGAVLLAVPAVLAGRRWEAVREDAGAHRRLATARWGAEVLVLAAAALALWQLRRYRSALVAGGDAEATLGADPVIVLAPCLALLAGALLVARLVAPVAAVAARTLGPRAGLPSVLAAWGTARAPAAHAASVLLVTLVVGSGVLVAGQQVLRGDEAERVAQQQVGSDLLLSGTSVTGPDRDDAVAAGTAVAAVDGVVGVAASHTQDLSTPAGAVKLASRTTGTDEALPEGAPVGPRVPSGARIEVDQTLSLTTRLLSVEGLPPDLVPDQSSTTTAFATTWWLSTDGYTVSRQLDVITVTAPAVDTPVTATTTSVLELPKTPRRAGGPSPAWELVAVDLVVPAGALAREMGFEIPAVRTDDGTAPEAPTGGWAVGTSPAAQLLPLPDSRDAGVLIRTPPLGFEPVRTRLHPRSLSDVAGPSGRPLPATVTSDLATALGLVEGERMHLAGGSGGLGVTAEHVTQTVPGLAPPAVLLDARGKAAADLLRDGQAPSFETWAVTVDPALVADDTARASLAQTVREAAGAAGVEVTVTDRRLVRQALLDDPVSVSAARAVVVAAVAAGVLALTGVMAAASSTATGRRRDEAVLTVLGTSGPQLRRADSVRTVMLGVLAVAAGLLLGLAVLWWCGPALVGDQSQPGLPARAAVRVPWAGLGVAAAAGLLLAGVPLLRRRAISEPGRELRFGETR